MTKEVSVRLTVENLGEFTTLLELNTNFYKAITEMISDGHFLTMEVMDAYSKLTEFGSESDDEILDGYELFE